MKCNADYLSFDTEQNNLALLGNAKVTYAKDIYDAQAISVDLKDNRITMDGSIRGTVND
jgi:lipopolysaccharide export system protein LptA